MTQLGSFEDLAASRRQWIDTVLRPWCVAAPLKELRRAELEWANIAGRVEAERTLYAWAWSRFPGIVQEEAGGLDETHEVRVRLRDGTSLAGWPDARRSLQGRLVLLCVSPDGETTDSGPHSIDDIASIERGS